MAINVVGPGIEQSRVRTIAEWKRKGWQRREGGLSGLFVTRYGKWWGRVVIQPHLKNKYKFFIFQPPLNALRKHPKRGCFPPVGRGWHLINFVPQLKNIDEGIFKVEKIISEAFSGRW